MQPFAVHVNEILRYSVPIMPNCQSMATTTSEGILMNKFNAMRRDLHAVSQSLWHMACALKMIGGIIKNDMPDDKKIALILSQLQLDCVSDSVCEYSQGKYS